ncbi:MAG: class I SAM-dependent methyltransferase [Chthoniobacterales bacterium]
MTGTSLAKLVLIMIATAYLLYQMRKPGRWVGRLFARGMNKSHSRLTDWGLQHVSIARDAAALDVGCGGGATIGKLARTARKVYGIDYAAGSVATARSHNAQLINDGRVEIKQASVSSLPFPDNQFDVITAVETQYYWPDLDHDMREVLRVLKPDGLFAVIAETYKGGRTDKFQRPVMALLRSAHLSPDDQRQLFAKAGYCDIQVFEEMRRGWICVTGRKPG